MASAIPDFDGDLPEAFYSILSCDYLKWRLSLEEYDFTDCPELPEPESLHHILRNKCYEVEQEMSTLITDMVTELNISVLHTYIEY